MNVVFSSELRIRTRHRLGQAAAFAAAAWFLSLPAVQAAHDPAAEQPPAAETENETKPASAGEEPALTSSEAAIQEETSSNTASQELPPDPAADPAPARLLASPNLITNATLRPAAEPPPQPKPPASLLRLDDPGALSNLAAADSAKPKDKPAPIPPDEADNIFSPPSPPGSPGPPNKPADEALEPLSPTATASARGVPLVPPSQNATINLIRRLVDRGILTPEDARDLIQQAEADAAFARTQAAATEAARAKAAAAHAAATDVRVAVNKAAAQAVVDRVSAEPTASTEDAVAVNYVPEVVKDQIREQVKDEVLATAREEQWGGPDNLPDWVRRFQLFGDVRVRYEGDYFPDGNDNTGAFPNFNAINTGPPFDVAGNQFPPELNVDEDRQRVRIRARFGAAVDLGEGFSGGIRIATGESNSPVSANQSLGLANNDQGGNFSKYAIWLDRAFLRYELGGEPTKNLAITIGRFDNPFFTVDQIIWDDDLGFDGFAVQGQYEVLPNLMPFATAGVFPVFNTDFNFSTNRPDKFPSEDKWLYAVQAGTDWQINEDLNLKTAVAYYYFDNVEGRLSSPFVPLTEDDQGDTDDTRPSFAQKGNTYRPLRDIIPTAENDFGTINQWQYFGLATPFEELAFTGQLDYNHFEPIQISLVGEFVKNLAFDGGAINAIAVNNRGPDGPNGQLGSFEGGDIGWIIGLKVGHPTFEKLWDWNAGVSYRYVESDAVIDGFCDSDFGLGGTNLQGFTIGGSLALSPRVSFGVRWMSANEIAGPPLAVDVFQVQFYGSF